MEQLGSTTVLSSGSGAIAIFFLFANLVEKRNRIFEFLQHRILDQSSLPFARDDAALRPIVLFLRCELRLVVGLRLACGERF